MFLQIQVSDVGLPAHQLVDVEPDKSAIEAMAPILGTIGVVGIGLNISAATLGTHIPATVDVFLVADQILVLAGHG